MYSFFIHCVNLMHIDAIVDLYKKVSKKFTMQIFPYLLIAASAFLSVQTINSVPIAYAAENLDRFWSILTGNQQTPPVTTDAMGYVDLNTRSQ